jgi:hypothetical protein
MKKAVDGDGVLQTLTVNEEKESHYSRHVHGWHTVRDGARVWKTVEYHHPSNSTAEMVIPDEQWRVEPAHLNGCVASKHRYR